MAGAGLLVYALESARIERAVNEQIDQEIAEFRELQRGVDPDTGEPVRRRRRLLNVFLTRNVPDDDEMLVGYAGGESIEPHAPTATARSSSTSPAYQRAVEAAGRPTVAPTTIDSPTATARSG